MSPGKAASRFGVTRPVGDRAIVLTFDGPINAGTTMVGIAGPAAPSSRSMSGRTRRA